MTTCSTPALRIRVINQLIQWSRSSKTFANRAWEIILARTGLTNHVIRKFTRETSHLSRIIDDEVEFAYAFQSLGVSITPLQDRAEITSLLQTLEELQPLRILELGTWSGGTLFLFSRISRPDAAIVSVDLPAHNFGGGYSAWRSILFHSFASSNQTLHLIVGDSHQPAVFNLVREALQGELLDFLFIDADHTYQGVRLDFEMYSPLVRRGGIIAFHDIASDNPKTGIVVHGFWDEIKKNYRYLEHVTNRSKAGIGLLWI